MSICWLIVLTRFSQSCAHCLVLILIKSRPLSSPIKQLSQRSGQKSKNARVVGNVPWPLRQGTLDFEPRTERVSHKTVPAGRPNTPKHQSSIQNSKNARIEGSVPWSLRPGTLDFTPRTEHDSHKTVPARWPHTPRQQSSIQNN